MQEFVCCIIVINPVSLSSDKKIFNLQDIVIGGTDTTSTMIEWTMTELMMHPDIMRKCQAELSDVVSDHKIVEETHLSKLAYLHAVVKETLRLHPAAPLLLPRSPSKSSSVGGYAIAKGTKVFLNVWAMHRDPQLWDHPLEFRPQRFLQQDEESDIQLEYFGNNLKYLPFGAGEEYVQGFLWGRGC